MAAALIAGCGAAPVPAGPPALQPLSWLVGCWREQGRDTYLEIEWTLAPDGLHGAVRGLDIGPWRSTLSITEENGVVVLREPSGSFFSRVLGLAHRSTARLLASDATRAVFEEVAFSYSPENDALIVDGSEWLSRCCPDGRIRCARPLLQ